MIAKSIIYMVLLISILVVLSTGSVDSNKRALNKLHSILSLTSDTVVYISSGTFNSAAVTSQGKVYVWGSNASYQLGLPNSESRGGKSLPVELTILSSSSLGNGDRVIQIDYSFERAIALTEQGRVFVWGKNFLGELGLGTTGEDADERTPVELSALSPSSLGNGDKVIQVSFGTSHSGALTQQGKVFTWGRDSYGELGLGFSFQTVPNPTAVSALAPSSLPNGDKVVQIDLGFFVTIAVTEQGRVFAFGNNEYGQLGLGNSGSGANKDVPTEVSVLSPSVLSNGDKVKQVDIGFRHVGALTEQGRLYMWGNNGKGQLGLGSNTDKVTPTEVVLLSPSNLANSDKVVQISIEPEYSEALTEQGEVFVWGSNEFGKLGIGVDFGGATRNTPTKIQTLSPSILPNGDKVVHISAGSSHSMVLTEQNVVYSWGSNSQGRLGLGDFQDRNVPTEIEFFRSTVTSNCPEDQLCCQTKLNGPICYFESERTCYEDLLCLKNELKCGDDCYRESQYSCENGRLVQKNNGDCPNGLSLCSTKLNGLICYSENERTCYGDLLCLKNELKCGNDCYKPSEYSCEGDKLIQIGSK